MAGPYKLRWWKGTGGGTGSGTGGGAGGTVLPAAYFGTHIGSLTPTTIWADYSASAKASYIPTPWPAIGIGTLRLWDGNGVVWRNIERSRGVYTWTYLDYYLAQAKAHGAGIIYTLGCAPDWATTSPGQAPGLYVNYNPFPPALDADWTDWCTAVATRIKNAGFPGAAYEIWNECNDNSYGSSAVGSGYAGSLARLVQLASLAYTAIKAVDPTAIILSPNFTGQDGIVGATSGTTLDTFLAAGGGAYCDVLSVHGYNTMAPFPRPESILNFGNTVKGIAAAHGASAKPVWNTEWGYGTWADSTGAFRSASYGTPAPDLMPDAQGANYITRMILCNWSAGFQRMIHYGYDAYNWQTITMALATDHATFKPASVAFAYAQGLLANGYLGTVSTQVASGVIYYRAGFTTAAGRSGYVAWCDDYATTTISIPGAVEVRDNLGAAITLASTLAVTQRPQFIFTS